jgi:general L-amino acid transport system substrate-binding protein
MAAAAGDNPEINRLLGTEGEYGAMMGLDQKWAVNAIKAAGNYGEIFEKHIGTETPIGLSRGLNALWTQGGLQYAAPFR